MWLKCDTTNHTIVLSETDITNIETEGFNKFFRYSEQKRVNNPYFSHYNQIKSHELSPEQLFGLKKKPKTKIKPKHKPISIYN